jgi:broad specificity phosphatase PhoE
VFCDKGLQNTTRTIGHENVLNVAAIYTSPLCRATKSAEILADCIQFPKNEIKIDEGLVEWNAGILQGTYFFFIVENIHCATHSRNSNI